MHRLTINVICFPFYFYFYFQFTFNVLILPHIVLFLLLLLLVIEWRKQNCDCVSKMKANCNKMKEKKLYTQKHNALHAIAWNPISFAYTKRERGQRERRNSERKISVRKCYGFKSWMFNLDVCLLSMYRVVSTSSCPLSDCYFATSSSSSFFHFFEFEVEESLSCCFCFASPNHIATRVWNRKFEIKWNKNEKFHITRCVMKTFK